MQEMTKENMKQRIKELETRVQELEARQRGKIIIRKKKALAPSIVAAIKQDRENGLTIRALSEKYCVSNGTAHSIVRGTYRKGDENETI